MQFYRRHTRHAGFSLIELVIVVVIIGIIGAIAIPRMSRGTEAAADSALKANLSVLRNAIDLYAAEHQGNYPALDNLPEALTAKTDINGTVDDGMTAGNYIYGPYVRNIPPLPVGPYEGNTAFTATENTDGMGWVYYEDTGDVAPNVPSTLADDEGKLYKDY